MSLTWFVYICIIDLYKHHTSMYKRRQKREEVKNQAHDIVYSIMAGSFKYKFDPNE